MPRFPRTVIIGYPTLVKAALQLAGLPEELGLAYDFELEGDVVNEKGAFTLRLSNPRLKPVSAEKPLEETSRP